MKNMTVAGLVAAPLLLFVLAMPSLAADTAATTCKDGTTTTSTGKGTCSGHGGIQKATKSKPAAAATTAAPAAAPPPSCCAGGIDHRRQVVNCDQNSADCRRKQYGSDRCHGEVQGRHLLQVCPP